MRSFLFMLLSSLPMLVACGKQGQPNSLADAFIQSFEQQKFELLEPYFPTVVFHKSLERNPSGTDPSDSAAQAFVTTSNQTLKESWTKINERMRSAKIDPSKLEIVETVSAQPFWTKKISKWVIVYKYDNKTWDDIVLIVGDHENKNLLLEIPEPEKVFSMNDTSLATSQAARFENEVRSPEFKKRLEEKVDTLVAFANANRTADFGRMTYYPLTDENGNPRPDSAMSDEARRQVASGFMEKIRMAMAECTPGEYGDINTLDLPDGKWIVIQKRCNTKFVHFAFIRVNGELLLNDVDAAGIR